MLTLPLLRGSSKACNASYLVRHKSSGSASSSRYLARQKNDHFVRSRNEEDYVSRSAFKLIELDNKHGFLKSKGVNTIVDLGASPGGWTQVVLERMQNGGHVFAVDLLAMNNEIEKSVAPSKRLSFYQGDFSDSPFQNHLFSSISSNQEGKPASVDVILSDMMVNTSGHWIRDTEALLRLHHSVSTFVQRTLGPKGWLVMKTFESIESQIFRKDVLENQFKKVWTMKPEASRKESREIYWICHRLK